MYWSLISSFPAAVVSFACTALKCFRKGRTGFPRQLVRFVGSCQTAVTQTALNYYIFQREAVVEKGLTRFTIAELSQVMRLFGVLIICSFLILATICAIQFSKVRHLVSFYVRIFQVCFTISM